MSEELLINVTPQETRVGVVENGVLQELHIERTRNRGIVGNIYKGSVVRVLPGMQAAFIDINLERTAFLHASDIMPTGLREERCEKEAVEPPPISSLLREGQEIVVQAVKDPINAKGARLTTQITIPARNLVYLPNSDHIGVSQKIQDEQERERLKEFVCEALKDMEYAGGFIIRTAAESATLEEIKSDVTFLLKLWRKVNTKSANAKSGDLLHEDLALAMRTIRDLVRVDSEKIRIDSRETFDKAKTFANELIPEVASHIEHYPGERPIFDLYSVEDEIQRALENHVPLKSGGYLVIDQTEAMTTVDVNTGAYVGRRNLDETLFKTNLEAAQSIARQLRLRNIGGIIIIDFIDMEDAEHRRLVMRALEKALAKDRTKTFISDTDMSNLGLVEITRKRTRESLKHMLTEQCRICGGRGVQKTAQTVCYEIFREILREARQFDANEFVVLASQVVVDLLLEDESSSLADLQDFIGKPIRLQVETMYHQELYDVVLT
ncbi:MAG: ribonuclease G [Gammaproteobacteria bacterium]|nr:ribonuclease G [Gammaproteobacteria bacterium]